MKPSLFYLQIIVFLMLSSCTLQSARNKVKMAKENTMIDSLSFPKAQQKVNIDGDKSMVNLVKSILISSPRYKQITLGLTDSIIKNGGDTFGISLQGSPFPLADQAWGYSKNYDLTIYELYPERRLGRAYFVFDPKAEKLYEIDMATQHPVSIDFNRDLLLKFDSMSSLKNN